MIYALVIAFMLMFWLIIAVCVLREDIRQLTMRYNYDFWTHVGDPIEDYRKWKENKK